VRALMNAGASEATASDWLSLRVERGLGVFGADYGPGDNPHEAALDRVAICWTKGCYLGQEAVFMQDARGKLKRRLAWLSVSGPEPGAGTPVLSAAGEAAGEVTSATVAADLAGSRALARLKAPHFESGVGLTVLGAPAVVVARPVW
jgi:folate-binding protein YgfZ